MCTKPNPGLTWPVEEISVLVWLYISEICEFHCYFIIFWWLFLTHLFRNLCFLEFIVCEPLGPLSLLPVLPSNSSTDLLPQPSTSLLSSSIFSICPVLPVCCSHLFPDSKIFTSQSASLPLLQKCFSKWSAKWQLPNRRWSHAFITFHLHNLFSLKCCFRLCLFLFD